MDAAWNATGEPEGLFPTLIGSFHKNRGFTPSQFRLPRKGIAPRVSPETVKPAHVQLPFQLSRIITMSPDYSELAHSCHVRQESMRMFSYQLHSGLLLTAIIVGPVHKVPQPTRQLCSVGGCPISAVNATKTPPNCPRTQAPSPRKDQRHLRKALRRDDFRVSFPFRIFLFRSFHALSDRCHAVVTFGTILCACFMIFWR
jgi:hypothetical protein